MPRPSLALLVLPLSFGCAATTTAPQSSRPVVFPEPKLPEPVTKLASVKDPSARDPYRLDKERAHRASTTWRSPVLNLSAFYEDVEFSEVEFEDRTEAIFGPGIRDVERKRVGLRLTGGVEAVSGFVQLFAEEIDQFDDSDLNPGTSIRIDDLFGIGVGVRSTPTLSRLGPGERLIADVNLGFNAVIGDGSSDDGTGREEGDGYYFEHEAQLGVGFDLHGFRPTFGVYLSALAGQVEDTDEDIDFDAVNPGLFLDLNYTHPRVPIRFGIRGVAGDTQGLKGYAGINL